jgi:hypothetical protein
MFTRGTDTYLEQFLASPVRTIKTYRARDISQIAAARNPVVNEAVLLSRRSRKTGEG